MEKIKKIIGTILAFTTGLGFYGLGLLAVGILFWLAGWKVVGGGFMGAFVFKNYETLVSYFKVKKGGVQK